MESNISLDALKQLVTQAYNEQLSKSPVPKNISFGIESECSSPTI
jgi:hypothetical protein